MSADRLEAWVEVNPGEPCDRDALAAALAGAGVVHGVDGQAVGALAESLGDGDFAAPKVVLARGRPPVPGKDGVLTLRFELGLCAGRPREDGSLDFFDRCLLQPMDQGEVVAVYQAATVGEPGLGVDGRPRKARDGRERLPRIGAGARLHGDGTIRAEVAGVVHHLRGKLLDVVSRHEHGGEVDLRSGNLETSGSLAIRGAVHTRLEVRAGASVEVGREVHCASVFAGGDLRVGGGIVGGEGAHVAVGGDIHTQFLQGATVECGGILRVAQYMIGSEVSAERVEVGGRVIGGRTHAERSLSAGELGTSRGQVTRILVRPRSGQPVSEGSVAFVEASLVHPGVRIAIGGQLYAVEHTLHDVRFVYDAETHGILMLPASAHREAS